MMPYKLGLRHEIVSGLCNEVDEDFARLFKGNVNPGRPAKIEPHYCYYKMNNSTQEAKRHLVANVSTNILSVGVNILLGIWLTPYLIRNLGIEVYGMIPLVVSFIQYFHIFTLSISGAVSRFVCIYLNRDEFEQGNIYFNSALFSLIVLACIPFIAAIFLSFFFSDIFNVPSGYEVETNWMFFYIMLSAFFFVISPPFQISTFITHRFDINNFVAISSRLLRMGLLLLLFTYLSPSLRYFGMSYAAMSSFFLISFILLTKWLTPQLIISKASCSWPAIREMANMGGWVSVNFVAAMLYIGITVILINIILGPKQVGRYGAIAQMTILMGQLGDTIGSVFAPIAFNCIARNQMEALATHIRRTMKFMVLFMALPIGLLCGLAKPILTIWLGKDFSNLWPLVWLLLGPSIITISVKPITAIFRGMNKVKMPAIIALVLGVVNVVLCVILMKFTNLGIYGAALSLLVCFAGRNLVFTPIYLAVITNQPKTSILKDFIPGLTMYLLLSLGVHVLSWGFGIVSIPQLIGFACIVFLLYSAVCYFIILNKDDKGLLWSLVLKRN